MKGSNIVSRGCAVALLLAALGAGSVAEAAMAVNCSFGNCSAQASESTLTVTCGGKQIYSGAFSMTTDFRTTQIAADPAGDPSITAQGIPAASAPVPATLRAGGQSTSGTCGMANGGQR